MERTMLSRSAIRPRLSDLYFRREQIDRAIQALEVVETLRARRGAVGDYNGLFFCARRLRLVTREE